MASAQVLRKQEHLEAGKRRMRYELQIWRKLAHLMYLAKLSWDPLLQYLTMAVKHLFFPLKLNKILRMMQLLLLYCQWKIIVCILQIVNRQMRIITNLREIVLQGFLDRSMLITALSQKGGITTLEYILDYVVDFLMKTTTDHSILPLPQSQDFENSTSQSSFCGTDESQSTESGSSLMQSSVTNPGYFHVSTAIVSPQDSVGSLSEANPSNASILISPQTHTSYGDSLQPTANVRGSGHEALQYMNGGAHINDSIISNFGERQLGSSVSGLPNVYKGALPAIETTEDCCQPTQI
ncbi:hypothetical protein CJ030_MR3G001115 [Morella rubra]|uniref:Uncharacterized protein n=1 Tax=Morella rubra TaxID=262757 RepID=A0A6A1W2F9_9ROSI|nr:hypothetical protein CJ030_MR3G001115 [Morella rubra]